MRGAVRWTLRVIGGLAALALVVAAMLYVATRTSFGMQRARSFAVNWLAGEVAGQVSLGRISGGGLLRGLVVHDLTIADSAGRPFVQLDSAALGYDILSLLRGRIVIDRVTVWQPVVHIEKLPGDEKWNFDRLFRSQPDTAAGPPGPARTIAFHRVRLHRGAVVVRQPIEGSVGAAMDWVIEEVPGGKARVVRFDQLEVETDEVVWESPGEPGKRFEIGSLTGRAFVFREPAVIDELAGVVTDVDSIISFDLRRFRINRTRGTVTGRVVRGEYGESYDIRVDAEHFDLADLGWIHARVPPDGEGRAIVRITSPDGRQFLWKAEDFTLQADGARMTGAAGVATGDALQLRAFDVRVAELSAGWLEQAAGRALPFEGTLAGSFRADGPLNRVRTQGDLRLNAPDGRAAARWNGTVALDGRFAARQLNLDVETVDVSLIDAVRPGLPIDGRVSGQLALDGDYATGIAVQGALTHASGAGATSQVLGGGTLVRRGSGAGMDVQFDARPLALETIARAVPSLERLHGTARGPISLAGTTDSLRLTAEVVTSAGQLTAIATIDRRGSVPRFVVGAASPGFWPARIGATDLDLHLSGRGSVDLEGSALANLRGPVRVDLDSAEVRGVPLQDVRVIASLASGTARLDTAILRGPGVAADASGVLGLSREQQGQLRVRLSSASLEPLEEVLFGEVQDPTAPRVGGRLEARGTVTGSIESLDIDATGEVDAVHYAGHSLVHASVDLTARALGSEGGRLTALARMDSLQIRDKVADSALVSLTREAGALRGRAEAWADGASALRVAGEWSVADSANVLRLDTFGFRSGERAWSLTAPATIRIHNGLAQVDPLRVAPESGPGSLNAAGTIAWTLGEDARARGLDFDLELNAVPFAELVSMVRAPVQVEGAVDGHVRVTGTTRAPGVDANVTLRGLQFQSATLERVIASVRYSDRRMAAQAAAFLEDRQVMTGAGEIPVDLTAPAGERRLDEPLSFTLQMDSFPAAFALGPISGFSAIGGLIDGRIEMGGTGTDPTLGGTLLVRRGTATWDATGVRYVDAEGTVLMNNELLADVDLTASTMDPRSRSGRTGTARVTGSVDLSTPTNPGFELTIAADRIIAARRRDVEMIASGRIAIDGRYRQPVVSGNLTVNRGNVYLDEIYRQYLIVQLENPRLINVVDTSLVAVRRILPPSENPFLSNLVIENATVSVNPGSWLRSREMDVEVSGDLTVSFDRQRDDLTISGALNVIRGTYRLEYGLFARVFDVREGTIEFTGTPGIDPNLSITAAYTARTGGEPLDIEAVVFGTLQAPRVRLQSDVEPPISESDLASYLFFGQPTYAIGSSSGSGGAFESIGRGVAISSGLGYFASGLQTLAQSFGIVDYVGLTAAETAGAGGTSSVGGLLANTKIELGRYLTPRLFVAYTQRLASAANDAGVRLEWRFHPTYTLELFAEDRFSRSPAIGLAQAIEARKVYGFFVFREWSY